MNYDGFKRVTFEAAGQENQAPTLVGSQNGDQAAPIKEAQRAAAAKSGRPMANKRKKWLKPAGLIGLILAAGILSGFGLFKVRAGVGSSEGEPKASPTASKAKVEVGKTYGKSDDLIFSDEAEGVLAEGGLDGEGSHHLVRTNGSTNKVYLTSSVLDLSDFVGFKIRVWGETFAAQKAGWLMDVGKIRVLEAAE